MYRAEFDWTEFELQIKVMPVSLLYGLWKMQGFQPGAPEAALVLKKRRMIVGEARRRIIEDLLEPTETNLLDEIIADFEISQRYED
jgi:hypothetical protein